MNHFHIKNLKQQWNKFYLNNSDKVNIQKPTAFAKYVLPLINHTTTLIDLGCGNGRDSFYFSKNGKEVLGLDYSSVVINSLNKSNIKNNMLNFNCLDFEHISNFKPQFKSVDIIYSRFLLHAIPLNTEIEIMKWVSNTLQKCGNFFLEARSIKDDFYGLGKQVGRNEFINGHYRRFIEPEELKSTLEKHNFKIDFFIEDKGLATFGNEDPIVIRIFASKK